MICPFSRAWFTLVKQADEQRQAEYQQPTLKFCVQSAEDNRGVDIYRFVSINRLYRRWFDA